MVPAYRLQRADGTTPAGPTRSCGCTRTLGDLTGRHFGRLVVTCEMPPEKKAGRMWRCLCDCGNEVAVSSTSLINGYVRSCGCLRRESIASKAQDGAKAAHTKEANEKRSMTVFGKPGSEARKSLGIKLRNELERSGVIKDHANIAIIAAESPSANNPYRGVCWNNAKNSWMAYCQVKGIKWRKTGFKTPEEAKRARDKKQSELLELTGLEEAIRRRKNRNVRSC